jgi:aspartate/methionine/tyrosine aminotransferase
VANASLDRDDVLAFWFGESDQPTPQFIRAAASAEVLAGRTFYTHNLGRAELRAALSAYLTDLHGAKIGLDRIAVTSSGVNALMVAMQALLSPGDRVVAITPVWPNVTEIPIILNAEVTRIALRARDGVWALDLDQLLAALTPDTRALLLNSPANPTGWVLPAEDRAAILELCRRYGIWIIADDVYERLSFLTGARSAPSFLPLATPEDRVISANTFSKAWRMTGWRLGWMVMPSALVGDVGKLLEFNTSCAPDFIQRAAVHALRDGEAHLEEMRADLLAKRDRLLGALRVLPEIESTCPDGGLYIFFRVNGCTDSVALAKALVAEAGLGLAPGRAFGPEGEGWLRWCFAAESAKLEAGIARLAGYLNADRAIAAGSDKAL